MVPAQPGKPFFRSRARDLLLKLVDQHGFTADDLAREIVATPASMQRFLDGTEPIPHDRQLCLALLLIERVPDLRRQGYQLRGQVESAVRIEIARGDDGTRIIELPR